MAMLWRSKPVRLVSLLAGGSLLALALSSCTVLPVTVNSVIGTYEPYNPALTNEGIPAEEVDFTVGGSPSGALVCLVEVLTNSGQMVGSTVITTGPQTGNSASVEESVPVDISGDIFNGSASNAIVRCGTKG